MSVWKDEKSVPTWRNFVEHRESQNVGRADDFLDYKITVCTAGRTYFMEDRACVPSDSNEYFDMKR